MRIIFITPLDLHHKFIISKIFNRFKNINIFRDKKKIKPKFSTIFHSKKKQTFYEKRLWLKKKLKLPKVVVIKDVNKIINIKKIKQLKPEVIVTLGSVKLSSNFLKNFKDTKIVNLHGGNPNCYRGLDSHYWAIYHNDFKNIKVCLHYVSNMLDTGKIIQINNIKLLKNMKLYQLRSKNAEIAAKILLKFLKNIFNKKKIILKNNNSGRYYSFMPTSIKKIVENKFNNFTKKI
jgi:methionyl-tRNA formyltransferase